MLQMKNKNSKTNFEQDTLFNGESHLYIYIYNQRNIIIHKSIFGVN